MLLLFALNPATPWLIKHLLEACRSQWVLHVCWVGSLPATASLPRAWRQEKMSYSSGTFSHSQTLATGLGENQRLLEGIISEWISYPHHFFVSGSSEFLWKEKVMCHVRCCCLHFYLAEFPLSFGQWLCW